ncbi:MAG: hypothetical protein WDZ39_01185 [Candidatus Spechtbacterales bacterium]
MNESIFKAYDIRGKYGEEFDNDFAYKLGSVLAIYLGAKNIVISRDMRPSSAELAKHVVAGVISTGCNVIDIGPSSTPLFYFGVINEKADGGVMITASHLGDEFNGFKVTREKAITIGGDELLEKTRELFNSELQIADAPGKTVKKDLIVEYTETAIGHSGLRAGDIESSIKLIGNEMVVKEARAVADKLSISVVEEGENIGFEFDADGDRLVLVSANGESIRGDLVGGLLAGYYYPNSKIAYDLRYSRGVLEYLESKGIELIPSRIGHTLIKAIMREHELDFCGEHSGHMFFKEMGYAEAPTLAMLKVLNILEETGKNIDNLVSEVSKWYTTDEINFTFESREKITEIIGAVKEKYSDGEINEMDGLRVEYSDWSFLLRASNTEAKLRLIVDARTEELLESEKSELVELIEKLE